MGLVRRTRRTRACPRWLGATFEELGRADELVDARDEAAKLFADLGVPPPPRRPEPMLLADLVATSASVASTRSPAKVDAIADLFRRRLQEIPIVVSYLSGELVERRTGVGWASLRDLPTPAPSRRARSPRSTSLRSGRGGERAGPVAIRREALAPFGRATGRSNDSSRSSREVSFDRARSPGP